MCFYDELNGLDQASYHVPVTPARAFIVIVTTKHPSRLGAYPVTRKIYPEHLTEELVQYRQVEAHDKTVDTWIADLRLTVFDVVEIQKNLAKMAHRTALVFRVIVSKNGIHFQPMLFMNLKAPVIQNIRRGSHSLQST